MAACEDGRQCLRFALPTDWHIGGQGETMQEILDVARGMPGPDLGNVARRPVG